ncbi:hypothetical protein IAT38_008443 [Cryptococcus sp. DSM 104549]
MTSMLHSQSFDGGRQQAHSLGVSPDGSPRIHRTASQTSLHMPPGGAYSPNLPGVSPQPYSAYPPAAYRHYPDNLALPLPTGFPNNYPATAPALPFYPTGPAQVYDPRGVAQPMLRTVNHAHPMNSATEPPASSRYSSSPHSATGQLLDTPATAAGAQPATGWGHPSFTIQGEDTRMVSNPVFPGASYSMSRSTSGASDAGAPDSTRLLTPQFEYRGDHHSRRGSPHAHEAELRKVSDSLNDPRGRIYSVNFTPSFDLQPHSLGLGPHPQPGDGGFNRGPGAGAGYTGAEFTVSSERGEKADLGLMQENEYERERQAQMMANKKLLEDVGLGGPSFGFRGRNASSAGGGGNKSRKPSTPVKKRLHSEAVRASPRIKRNISYANLDNGAGSSEDEYGSDEEFEQGDEDEEEFRPSKKSRGAGMGGYRQKSVSYSAPKKASKPQLSLWGLLQVYPEIPHLFPLFYYTLNNDLTINSDSVPLIGSIPSTCTPLEKADTLQAFFHRGRRVLAQLDAFGTRCDRKYDGPEQRWPELDYHTRIAVRDVRRKVVERCENYKYTRRDILDKFIGKNKWQAIETGMVEWRPGMTVNDPAGDLANVTLTLPTPPPEMYHHQQAAQQQAQLMARHQVPMTQTVYSDRPVKPFPTGRRMVSTAVPRNVSIMMAEPDEYPATATAGSGGSSASGGMLFTAGPGGYPQQETRPMYGEDQVPLSVQLPGSASLSPAGVGAGVAVGGGNGWDVKRESRVIEGVESPESEGV